jgi:hypothetical protein
MADATGRPGGGELPAVYSNWFVVSTGSETVRIAFAEAFGVPESAVFHSAVAMSPANAVALAELILRLDRESKQKPLTAAQGQADGA